MNSRGPGEQEQQGERQVDWGGTGETGARGREVSIIQFNCGQANYSASRLIFDALEPALKTLIAIQEPAFNKLTNTTYCPRGYRLIYEANPATRVCFMVSEALGVGHWRHQSYGPHAIKLELQVEEGPLSIINVYNPRDQGPRIRTWTQIEQA